MPSSLGTRVRQIGRYERIDQGNVTRNYSRDVGLLRRVSAVSLTFTTTQATAANGTFVGFAVDDIVVFAGTNLNNTFHTVTAIDVANQAYLTLDPPPVSEGPVTGTCRVQ